MSCDAIWFPVHWYEYIKKYKFNDKEEVYTNGSDLIPVSRVENMVEHYFAGDEVIRCRYCNDYNEENMHCMWLGVDTYPEGFCAWGETR